MLNLFDHGTPRDVAQALPNHTVKEARAMGWDTLSNGDLLKAAEAAGFGVLVSTDQNLRYQQNLTGRQIAIVVLGKARWQLIQRVLAGIASAVNVATPGSCVLVDIPDRPRE